MKSKKKIQEKLKQREEEYEVLERTGHHINAVIATGWVEALRWVIEDIKKDKLVKLLVATGLTTKDYKKLHKEFEKGS
jgi:uncharacterized protein (DUF697 family)